MRRIDLAPRWTRLRALLLLGFCVFGLVGWQGASTVGHEGAIDAGEHLRYAEFLATHHRLPNRHQNYEFGSPPLFQATAVVAEKLVRIVPATAVELPRNWLTRGAWIVLVALGAWAMTAVRRTVRKVGATGLGLAFLWGLDEAIMLCKGEEWTAGQLIALACGAGLILVTGLIAREVWPRNTARAVATGSFVAAYPVLYRMSILFHPEVPFAFLCSLALLFFLRGARLGWTTRSGWSVGIACGLAAATREPGALVIACLGVSAIALGGKASGRFLLRAAVPIALIAGSWWIYSTYRFGNPLQSNLQLAPGKMRASQPASFYLSAPLRSLVVHPYRPDFTNELLPKLHSDLWSDWYGGIQGAWHTSSKGERVTAASQSVLGFFGDALALVGLFALAIPAGVRLVLRRPDRTVTDDGLAVLAVVAVAAFAGFVFTLIRFPQVDGDPIKSSYLLFTAPCWALFSVAAWVELRRRWRRVHLLLVSVAVLYVVSYAAFLGTALAQPSAIGNLGERRNNLDLSTVFQQTSPNPGIGGPIQFLVGVNENGTQDANDVVLTIDLPPAMVLQGAPFVAQGTGCVGTVHIRCDLDEIPGGSDTYIRMSVDVDAGGDQTMTATVSSAGEDAHEGNNTSSETVNLGPA